MALALGAADVRPGHRVLDVGCGTGALLAALAARVPGVALAGADPSEGMLAVARAKLAAFPRRTLVRAEAAALPFPDGAFDRVVSTSVLHYLSDPARALREARRLLAPEGRVVVVDWCADYASVRALDAVLRRTDPAHARTFTSDEVAGFFAAAGLRLGRLSRTKTGPVWGFTVAAGSAA